MPPSAQHQFIQTCTGHGRRCARCRRHGRHPVHFNPGP